MRDCSQRQTTFSHQINQNSVWQICRRPLPIKHLQTLTKICKKQKLSAGCSPDPVLLARALWLVVWSEQGFWFTVPLHPPWHPQGCLTGALGHHPPPELHSFLSLLPFFALLCPPSRFSKTCNLSVTLRAQSLLWTGYLLIYETPPVTATV